MTIGDRHSAHAQQCWCLNDSAECCMKSCPCHIAPEKKFVPSNPLTEVECEVEGCTYRNRIIHGTSWAYHYVNEHGGFGESEEVEGLVLP